VLSKQNFGEDLKLSMDFTVPLQSAYTKNKAPEEHFGHASQNYQNLHILGLHLRRVFMLIERKLCRCMSKECMISLRCKKGYDTPHVSRTLLFSDDTFLVFWSRNFCT